MAGQDNAQLDVEVSENRVTVRFPRSLYPLDAVYGAAYIFIDRCFVLLDAPSDDVTTVRLSGRDTLDAAALEALAGEFGNELLTQAWRGLIVAANQPIIEAVAAQALAGAAGAPGLAELGAMDFSEDTFDDPLGIAMSWEEKYGKEPVGPAVEGAPRGAPPGQAAAEPDAGDDAKGE